MSFEHYTHDRMTNAHTASTFDPKLFDISDEVTEALAASLPVVALESTVIAHGLPRPRNLETAVLLEQVVREGGAVPATIAVLGGRICVGLSSEQLSAIADGDDIHKLSMRDLSVAVSEHWDGATTVATTMWIANRAGISIFATGGIGGVHRGSLPDVSADLVELARTPMVVVCAGAKIVLDLPATREWLETHGVPVLGYHTGELPAFYSRSSGLSVDVNVDSVSQVANLVDAQRRLGLGTATLLTVPIPEESELPITFVEGLLSKAMAAAEAQSIHGRDLTPFLLSTMNKASDGRMVEANIALLVNNTRVAVQVARALTSLKAFPMPAR